jgi:hypothetical protein
MSKTLKYLLGANYIILGLLSFFFRENPAFDSFPIWAKWSLPFLLVIYGAFRIYRNYTNLEEIDETE